MGSHTTTPQRKAAVYQRHTYIANPRLRSAATVVGSHTITPQRRAGGTRTTTPHHDATHHKITLYAYLRHAFSPLHYPTTDRRLRSSVGGYLYTSPFRAHQPYSPRTHLLPIPHRTPYYDHYTLYTKPHTASNKQGSRCQRHTSIANPRQRSAATVVGSHTTTPKLRAGGTRIAL